MSSRSSRSWRLVLLAAARLASIYAIASALLLLPLVLWFDGPAEVVRNLKDYATPVAVAFGVAFAVLAVARRAGFVALWLALTAIWAWVAPGGQYRVLERHEHGLRRLERAGHPIGSLGRIGRAHRAPTPAWSMETKRGRGYGGRVGRIVTSGSRTVGTSRIWASSFTACRHRSTSWRCCVVRLGARSAGHCRPLGRARLEWYHAGKGRIGGCIT
jgi:hypothetical protein